MMQHNINNSISGNVNFIANDDIDIHRLVLNIDGAVSEILPIGVIDFFNTMHRQYL